MESDFGHSHCLWRQLVIFVQQRSIVEPDLSQHVSVQNQVDLQSGPQKLEKELFGMYSVSNLNGRKVRSPRNLPMQVKLSFLPLQLHRGALNSQQLQMQTGFN